MIGRHAHTTPQIHRHAHVHAQAKQKHNGVNKTVSVSKYPHSPIFFAWLVDCLLTCLVVCCCCYRRRRFIGFLLLFVCFVCFCCCCLFVCFLLFFVSSSAPAKVLSIKNKNLKHVSEL